MDWYNTFASFYDLMIEPHYRKARKEAAKALAAENGDTILDLACGTGPNFKYLSPIVGEEGSIIALDFSKGMINKARKKIISKGWKNITLLQEDAKFVTRRKLESVRNKDVELDGVIVVLGLSVIPEYEKVLDNTFKLLKEGGRYIIVDVFADRWVPQSSIVKLIARADLKRRPWEYLEANCNDFSMTYLSKTRHLHGGLLYMAKGVK